MNKRQKLKRLKLQLKHATEKDCGIVTFPLEDPNLDIDVVSNFLSVWAKAFPNVNWMLIPNKMSLTFATKEQAKAFFDECKKVLERNSE